MCYSFGNYKYTPKSQMQNVFDVLEACCLVCVPDQHQSRLVQISKEFDKIAELKTCRQIYSSCVFLSSAFIQSYIAAAVFAEDGRRWKSFILLQYDELCTNVQLRRNFVLWAFTFELCINAQLRRNFRFAFFRLGGTRVASVHPSGVEEASA